ncbi:unnamed protein product [Rangifer tarandus platyrhynchus]|uniref:Uncharacterized protein n=1 Tax=Rangifer tarandus platyrhynchus TaxID=3082113 RepID=A0AC59ZWF6_RANTA
MLHLPEKEPSPGALSSTTSAGWGTTPSWPHTGSELAVCMAFSEMQSIAWAPQAPHRCRDAQAEDGASFSSGVLSCVRPSLQGEDAALGLTFSGRKPSLRDSSRGPAPCWPLPLPEQPPSWSRGFAFRAGLRISASISSGQRGPGGLGVDTDGTTGRVAGPPVPGDACAAVPPASAGGLREGPAAPSGRRGGTRRGGRLRTAPPLALPSHLCRSVPPESTRDRAWPPSSPPSTAGTVAALLTFAQFWGGPHLCTPPWVTLASWSDPECTRRGPAGNRRKKHPQDVTEGGEGGEGAGGKADHQHPSSVRPGQRG